MHVRGILLKNKMINLMSHSGFILAWPVLERKYQSRKIPDPEKTPKEKMDRKRRGWSCLLFFYR